MPQMGFDMQEGTVVRWLKKEGEEVRRGEVIAEIETDKAVVEMEATDSGLLRKIMIKEGVTVPVGQPIGVIGTPDEAVPAEEELSPTQIPAAEAPSVPPQAPAAPSGEVKASPVARRMADEMGIDLRKVTGSGPGGRITKEDILRYEASLKEAPQVAAEELKGERVPLSRMRQAIARVTTRSKQEIPHFYVSATIDMTRAMALRQELNQTADEGTPRISVNDMIVKAAVKALQKHPAFNASFQEDHLKVHPAINVGIAIALEEGLTVPAIMRCEDKSLIEIARASKDLIERAQRGVLHPDEYTAGTFSVSNLGMFDIDAFVAIIHPPNSVVLALGAVRRQPVVRGNEVIVAEVMTATLSIDHRVADGALAARFLAEVKSFLENPLSLLV